MIQTILDFFNDFLLSGVISGIIASIIFHFSLKSMKPKINISEHISKYIENNQTVYRVKIVNQRRRYIINPQFSLEIYRYEIIPSGRIVKMDRVELTNKLPTNFYPYKIRDREAHYSVRILLPSDLEEKWDENCIIQLKVYAIDEFSNSGRLFIREYFTKDCIKTGVFATGKSMKIEEFNKAQIIKSSTIERDYLKITSIIHNPDNYIVYAGNKVTWNNNIPKIPLTDEMLSTIYNKKGQISMFPFSGENYMLINLLEDDSFNQQETFVLLLGVVTISLESIIDLSAYTLIDAYSVFDNEVHKPSIISFKDTFSKGTRQFEIKIAYAFSVKKPTSLNYRNIRDGISDAIDLVESPDKVREIINFNSSGYRFSYFDVQNNNYESGFTFLVENNTLRVDNKWSSPNV